MGSGFPVDSSGDFEAVVASLSGQVLSPGCSLETTQCHHQPGEQVDVMMDGRHTVLGPAKHSGQAVKLITRFLSSGCELISLLGSGGMGTVFWFVPFESAGGGQDLHEEFAANRFHPGSGVKLTLAALDHPNVVGCHGIVTQDGVVYLIMEYIQPAQCQEPAAALAAAARATGRAHHWTSSNRLRLR